MREVVRIAQKEFNFTVIVELFTAQFFLFASVEVYSRSKFSGTPDSLWRKVQRFLFR
jgi:hypothetical protein